MNNCDITLWVEFNSNTVGSKCYPPIMWITFPGYISIASLLFFLIHQCKVMHVIVITWAWGICLICISEALRPQVWGMRAFMHIRKITNAHVTSVMSQFHCYSNNTSSLNATSNCHTCLWGYKYKLLMHYSQGVEYLLRIFR